MFRFDFFVKFVVLMSPKNQFAQICFIILLLTVFFFLYWHRNPKNWDLTPISGLWN